jgi:hypothetical protein
MAISKATQSFQASATNTAGSTTTGTGADLTAAYETVMVGKITNGATGPTVACDFIVDVSNDNSDWMEFARFTAGVANNGVYYFPCYIPPGVMYARSRFTGNTGQSVTVECDGHKLTGI